MIAVTVIGLTRLEMNPHILYSGFMDIESAVIALSALAHSTRLNAFKLLVCHKPDGMPAGEVARQLNVPQNTMSVHLATLARAGLVQSERHSRHIVYRADCERLAALTLFLIEDCCDGRAEVNLAPHKGVFV